VVDGTDAHILGSLATELATSESGELFVHAALDRLVADGGFDDALLIAQHDSTRRVFRAGWQAPDEFPDQQVVRSGLPGLYTVPAENEALRSAVDAMCQTALRMDVLAHDASHDALTGLFNRRSFDAQLEQALARADRYGWPFGLALLDLDHFKRINDEHGHQQGDVVLRLIGSELRRTLRGSDVAARIGGDEFALILVDGTPELLSTVIDRVSSSVHRGLDGMAIGISAGLAFAPEDGSDPDALYRIADDRLYASKGR
jgi:diguanylate cyclase (GGDEF)-like protein